jgi:hypothetical protein
MLTDGYFLLAAIALGIALLLAGIIEPFVIPHLKRWGLAVAIGVLLFLALVYIELSPTIVSWFR